MTINVFIVSNVLIKLVYLNEEISEISKEHMPLTELTTELAIYQLEQAIEFERASRFVEKIKVSTAANSNLLNSKNKFNKLNEKINNKLLKAIDFSKRVALNSNNKIVKDEYSKLASEFTEFNNSHKIYEEHVIDLVFNSNLVDENNGSIENKIQKIEHEQEVLDKKIESILFEIKNFTKKSILEVERHEKEALMFGVVSSIVSFVLIMPICFFIINGIVKPLKIIVRALGFLANNDTSLKVEITGQDEVGKTALAYEILREEIAKAQQLSKLRQADEQAKQQRAQAIENLTEHFSISIKQNLAELNLSVSSLEEGANTMAAAMDQTRCKAKAIANSSEITSNNVSAMAAAIEQMDSSIGEISSQIGQSSKISNQAVKQAIETNSTVKNLEDGVHQIGEIVNLISDIAEQTNLLALNATIEAARAGEQGKGFAIVASEVKQLATQTASATEDISRQIGNIQSNTNEAVKAIECVGATIGNMDDVISTIENSIKEQLSAAKEIAKNVNQTSVSTNESKEAISEIASATKCNSKVTNEVYETSKSLTSVYKNVSSGVNEFIKNIKSA